MGAARETSVFISSSCAVVGSRTISSEEVDRAFGMPAGKLRSRAGIESLAYAAKDENELTLGARAAQQALHAAACGAQELDWIIATSETHAAIHRSQRSFTPNSLLAKAAAHLTSEARVSVS